MFLAKVIGNLVSTKKTELLTGRKLLIVEPVDFEQQQVSGTPLVAVDTVGAGEGELVLVVQGSSARLTESTKETPCDASIMAIVDYIEFKGTRTFAKS